MARNGETGVNYQTTKIEAGLLAKARIVCAVEGKGMAELVSDLLRDRLEARYQQAVQNLAKHV